jgi:hypothetical protein
MTFYRQNTIKAKKDHTCDFCGARISAGEMYLYSASKLDGDFFVWKEHLDCREVGLAYMKLNQCDTYSSLSEMDDEDRALIKKDFPSVWARATGKSS